MSLYMTYVHVDVCMYVHVLTSSAVSGSPREEEFGYVMMTKHGGQVYQCKIILTSTV